MHHIFKTSGDNETFRYDGKCKRLNKLTAKVIIGWILFLCFLAFLGSIGVVLPIR